MQYLLKTIALNKVTNRWRNHNNKTMKISDDGGHDVIDNFEFLCNSMENLISI